MRLFRLSGQGFRSRGGRALRALVAIALILVAGNFIAARYAAVRLDLTGERLYTLARGTRQTLAKIEEPITLRLYYSNRLVTTAPTYGVYAQRVRELLDQYVAAAHGKLRLEVYDPQPFSDAEDRAAAYGLQAAPLNDQGEAVYFGLAGTNSTDDQQVIAFFNPERERFLEYDLTRLVHTLALPKRTVVGLLTDLPLENDPAAAMQGKPAQPMAIIGQLRQVDDVEKLPTDIEAIPPKIDVLMLAHPQKLSDATLFAIDQFVLKGGKAVVFFDPYSELQAGLPSPHADPSAAPPASELEPLFKAWGLTMLPGVVAGDRLDARRVAVPVEGRGPQTMDYVGWLNLPAANLNRDDPITADLNEITMATAGILEPVAGATTKFEPLIQTSADSDMLDDRFWAQSGTFFGQRVVQPVSNNSDFLANAVEVLAGGDDLIGLRSRGTTARPFVVVERIQRSADDRYAAEQRTLQEKLKQAQAKLHNLTNGDSGSQTAPTVTAEQTKEIDKFRADMLATRQQLRQVQAAERQDIGHLKVILEFFDIALVPIVVVVAAIVLAALRPRRRRAARA